MKYGLGGKMVDKGAFNDVRSQLLPLAMQRRYSVEGAGEEGVYTVVCVASTSLSFRGTSLCALASLYNNHAEDLHALMVSQK